MGTGLTLFLPPPTPSPAALAAVLTQLPALLSASLHDATKARQGGADTQLEKKPGHHQVQIPPFQMVKLKPTLSCVPIFKNDVRFFTTCLVITYFI